MLFKFLQQVPLPSQSPPPATARSPIQCRSPLVSGYPVKSALKTPNGGGSQIQIQTPRSRVSFARSNRVRFFDHQTRVEEITNRLSMSSLESMKASSSIVSHFETPVFGRPSAFSSDVTTAQHIVSTNDENPPPPPPLPTTPPPPPPYLNLERSGKSRPSLKRTFVEINENHTKSNDTPKVRIVGNNLAIFTSPSRTLISDDEVFQDCREEPFMTEDKVTIPIPNEKDSCMIKTPPRKAEETVLDPGTPTPIIKKTKKVSQSSTLKKQKKISKKKITSPRSPSKNKYRSCLESL